MAVNSIVTNNAIYFVLFYPLRVIINPPCFLLWPMMDAQGDDKASLTFLNHHLSSLEVHVLF